MNKLGELGVSGRFAHWAKVAQEQMAPAAARAPCAPRGEDNSGIIDFAALQARDTLPDGTAMQEAPPARAFAGRRRLAACLPYAAVALAAAAAGGTLVGLRRADPRGGIVRVVAAAPAPSPAAASPAPPLALADPTFDPASLPYVSPAAAPGRGAPIALAAQSPPPPVRTKDASARAAVVPAANAHAQFAPAAVPAGGDDRSLESLMRQAVGAFTAAPPVMAVPEPAISPEPASANVPLRPSLGAISSALGSVLPSARECLDEDAPLSRASITFQSDGSVGTVAVSGWAAGKPAGACIQVALGKARVPPFAQPTYTVPTTIRSN